MKELRSIGVQPDFLICRSDRVLPADIKSKIALFCNLPAERVFSAPDVDTIYRLPLLFSQEGLGDAICQELNIWTRKPDLRMWEDVVQRYLNPKGTTRIGIVGKYVHLVESYKSLNEALAHGGLPHQARVELEFISSDELEKGDRRPSPRSTELVPGGFGERVARKIACIHYARENGSLAGSASACRWPSWSSPATLGLDGANSREFDEHHAVIDLMEEQKEITMKGGTMRLGSYPCRIEESSLAHSIYGTTEINSSSPHEVNNDYRDKLAAAGLKATGTSPDGLLCEIVELQEHPWFFGCQFHPEYKSKPNWPHRFTAFVRPA